MSDSLTSSNRQHGSFAVLAHCHGNRMASLRKKLAVAAVTALPSLGFTAAVVRDYRASLAHEESMRQMERMEDRLARIERLLEQREKRRSDARVMFG